VVAEEHVAVGTLAGAHTFQTIQDLVEREVIGLSLGEARPRAKRWGPLYTGCAVRVIGSLLLASLALRAQPPMSVADLNAGEPAEVRLHDGGTARVELLERTEVRDNVRGAVRSARVRVKVNGREVRLDCGNYHLPVTVAGVQVDCAVTKGLLGNSRTDPWGLVKEARLRLWPAGSPLMTPGAYVYPVKQRWFATTTQMANQPSFVDGSETPWDRKIYYHYGLDIGGAEGLTKVVSATAGLVVVRGRNALPGYENSPYTELSYDGVIVRDERGWYHWYFHLFSIDPGVKLGQRIAIGQPVGLIGKEGSAGCWSLRDPRTPAFRQAWHRRRLCLSVAGVSEAVRSRCHRRSASARVRLGGRNCHVGWKPVLEPFGRDQPVRLDFRGRLDGQWSFRCPQVREARNLQRSSQGQRQPRPHCV
jgi:hypothetical protein